MAPGPNELIEGIPFVGKSGALLWRAFYDNGLDPRQAYVLNVINCAPGKNGKITPEQWAACARRFELEVQGSAARLVVPLGADALLRCTGIKGEITKWRGHLVRPDECEASFKVGKTIIQPALPPGAEIIIPTLHPSYIMRKGLVPVPFLWADIDRVKRALTNDLVPIETDSGGEWDLDSDLAVDLETDGIERNSKITLIGVAGWSHGRLVAHSWTWPPPPWVLSRLRDAPRLVGHNLAFDLGKLTHEGFRYCGRLYDTMWAGQKIEPDLEKNLDTMSSLYLDCPRFKTLPTTNIERPRLDALYTLAMVPAQVAYLKDKRQLHIHRKEMRALPILIAMAETGVRVDPVVRDALKADLLKKLESALEEWRGLAPNTNPASPVQLKRLFYDEIGLPRQYKGFGATRALTTEKPALIKLLRTASESERHLLRTLMSIRENSKLLSVYFNREADVLYPSYYPTTKDKAQYGTATGRLSAQDPNIQQVPKALRRMFVPHTPGNIFIIGDWSQIEAWIAARLSGDAALLHAIAGDIHAVNAALFKCDRTRAKNFYYGTTYGAGPRKIHETLLGRGFDVAYRDVADMMTAFKRGYPDLMHWRQLLLSRVRENGYAENCFGRRRYFYDPARSAPEIWAFQPSSNAADVLWACMHDVAELSRWASGHPPTLFCHDEIVLETRPDRADETADRLRAIMEQEWREIAPGFRVPAKITRGPSWGENE